MSARTHHQAHSPALSPVRLRIRRPVFAILTILFACGLCLTFPQTSHADGERYYTINPVNITAKVDEAGTLYVSETRTYHFHGQFNGVYQTIAEIPDGSTLQLDGAQVKCGIGEEVDLPSIPFKDEYGLNPAGAPTGHYTYDEDNRRFYVFNRASDTICYITVNYSITHFVQFYDDTAELYWQFIGDEWDEPNYNISVDVTLPVPEGRTVKVGEDVEQSEKTPSEGASSNDSDGKETEQDDRVFIFGHGPSDAEIHMQGSVVHATVLEAGDGDFAEMRVLYPRDWAQVKAGAVNVHSGAHLEEALDEERDFIERPARRARMISDGAGALGGLSIVGVIVAFVRYGKEYRPEFKEKYWRDVPDPDVHPATTARIWSWGKKKNDVQITLMHLAHIGAIRLVELYDETRKKSELAIVKVADADESTWTRTDELVMSFLFTTVGEGLWKRKSKHSTKSDKASLKKVAKHKRRRVMIAQIDNPPTQLSDVVFFSDFERRAKQAPTKFKEAIEDIRGHIDNEVKEFGAFERRGSQLQIICWTLAAILAIGAIVMLFVSSPIALAVSGLCAVAAIVTGGFAIFMRRRSPRANEIAAKSEALKRWLEDFSLLNEHPMQDVKVWGELMVYAAAFGVADKVMEQLRAVLPQVATSSDFMTTGAWVSYSVSSDSSGSTPFESFSDSLSTSIAATTSGSSGTFSGGGGSFSSGGFGGGGGFSGGGGGGFGGGGGGAF